MKSHENQELLVCAGVQNASFLQFLSGPET